MTPASESLWPIEREPTNLIALWPGEAPPDCDEIARHFGAANVQALPIDDPSFLWCRAIGLPSRDEPLVVWVERARDLDPRDLARLGVAAGRWALGVEAILDDADAPADFADLLGRVARALPAPSAILDVNTGRWFPTRELDRIFGPEGVEPPAEALWIIESAGDADVVSLRTRGLERGGRPEIEIVDVERASAEAAAILLDAVAERFVEEGAPPPDAMLDVAPGIAVAVRAGGGERASTAVLCAPAPRDGAARLTWPRDAIERIARGEAALYIGRRATERQAALARAGWDALVRLARSASATSIRVQVAFAVGADESRCGDDAAAEDREHLWFEAESLDEEGFVGVLLHAPALIESLAPGSRARLSRAAVSDFDVLTPSGRYGPRTLLARP